MQFDFFPYWLFNLMFLIFPILFCIALIIGIRNVRKFSSISPKTLLEGFTVQPPPHAFPESSRSDGSDIRTVRLPNFCPKCGAALTHEDIDWVGPLEAKCNYCGGTVRASLEKL